MDLPASPPNGGEFSPPPNVDMQGGERVVWEFQQVTLNRVPGYGFGIAVSGGRDNPHFANGDPSIAVSDVLKAGPAEGKLMVNDRITSANGISFENVDYGRAVQVLRDSGNTVTLSVRRRLLLPSQEPHILRVQLNKSRKKDDFGLILGSKIYVRDVAHSKLETNGGPSLQEGDILMKINNQPTDSMSLKDARKLIESSKEKLHLTVRRETSRSSSYNIYANNLNPKDGPNFLDNFNNCSSTYGTSQNLYVQPPTRQHNSSNSIDSEKSNLVPKASRSRNPVLDVSLSQLDRAVTPVNINGHDNGGLMPAVKHAHSHSHNLNTSSHENVASHSHSHSFNTLEDQAEHSRTTNSRHEDFYGSTRPFHNDESNMHRQKFTSEDPRFIAFQKEGSVGIRLIGGNEVGIFVTAVQPGSAAAQKGLQPADKILKANDLDMKGVTREEAVIFLLNVQDQVHLIVQNRREEYEQIISNRRADSFHIKAHFDYDQPSKGEMSFRKGDVFHVTDTLHNGVVGSWECYRIGRNNQEVQQGIIPNKARAEELATAQFNATKKELTASESRISFFRRKRNNHRRSKSLSKDHWDDVVFGDSISKFPAYERVILKHPGFIRPVILYGPVSDLAKEKLIKDFPDKFSYPQLENPLEDVSKKSAGIIRLSAIRDIMDHGKHALLDIMPNAVDRLNYAQFYPIVILLRAETKHIVKELRSGIPKSAHKSSKKLFEQSQKLEKMWSHIFSGSITLTGPDSWYRKLRELIEKNQGTPVWLSEAKPDEVLSDDFLFPMTSLRLSYASSPESDLDQSNGLLDLSSSSSMHHPRMVKCSSDPSIATQDDGGVPNYNPPPPYSPTIFKQSNYELSSKHHHAANEKYGYSQGSGLHLGSSDDLDSMITNGIPDPPPRVDRASKPLRPISGVRSAQERLFGSNSNGGGGSGNGGLKENGELPNYINHRPQNSSILERHNSILATGSISKNGGLQCSYDSVSSYESYNAPRSTLTSGINGNDDHNIYGANEHSAMNANSSKSAHDPYRFTRSTQQPIKQQPTHQDSLHAMPNKQSDYPQYRPPGMVEYATNKPLPPPKTSQSYKPVPPPKPKSYTIPPQHAQQASQSYYNHNSKDANAYQHAKSYSMADTGNYGTHMTNGLTSSPSKYSADNSDSNGFDSGHGSSLDRTYDRRTGFAGANSGSSGSQFYYNVAMPMPPQPNKHHHRGDHPNGLDLNHREQRGSAFEIYKKPSDHRSVAAQYHMDRSVR